MLSESPEVQSWLSGTLKMSKSQEDEWGRKIVAPFRSNKEVKAWSGLLGETLIQEMFPGGWKPEKKKNLKPDWETINYIIEVKTQSWFTPGTAGEKILGVFIKYRNIPELYGKPLLVVCFGRAESIWFDEPRDERFNEILKICKKFRIVYVRGSKLLLQSCVSLGFLSELTDVHPHPALQETLTEQEALPSCSSPRDTEEP